MLTEVPLLKTVSIFRKLDESELSAVADLILVREAAFKECLLEEGKPVTHFYIISAGAVHIRRLAGKREMLLARMGPGHFFGEINLFDPGVASASIYAMKPTRLLEFEYGRFHTFMEENPAAGYKIVAAMMTELARRFRQTNARLVATAYSSRPDMVLDGREG